MVKPKHPRAKTALIYVPILLVLFILIGVTAPDSGQQAQLDASAEQTQIIEPQADQIEAQPEAQKATVEEKIVTEKEIIVFDENSQPDPALPVGHTKVLQPGKNGEKTLKYKVIYTNGKETAREFITEVITLAPINEIVATGTYVKPVAPAPQPTATNCKIKGNISYTTGEKIYHIPGQRFYDITKIDTAKGERWFCTEAEAIKAGWRQSKL